MTDFSPLSLEDFRKTKTLCEDLAEEFGYVSDDKIPGYIYENACSIEIASDEIGYQLIIGNQIWTDHDLSRLEEILYREFYLPEICGVS